MVGVVRAFRSWLTPAIIGALIVGVIAGGSLGLERQQGSQPATSSKLVLEKKVFGIDEQPTMHLKAGPEPVSWFGSGRAYAAEPVQTEVTYDGNKIDAPVDVARTSDGYTIKLKRTPDSKAGKYSVKAKWGNGPQDTATQTFAWGVLSVNTTRPAYLPDETARIEMGVLSSSGHTLCAAPVTLTVYDPDGKKTMPAIHNSPLCKGDSYITEPDYYSSYKTGRAGHYRMVLRMADSDYALEAGFDVKNNLPFVIERTAPTRLFPPATYTNVIKVTARKDFEGTVVERLPEGFTVTDARGGRAEGTTISWNASMKAGQSSSFAYSFKAPIKSPAFYELSRLTIKYGSEKVYTEERSWQMAGDAVITFVQQNVTNVTSVNTTQTSSIPTTAPGSLLVLMIAMATSSTSCGPSSITDSAGNTWTYSTTLGPQGTNNPQDPPSNLSTSSTFATEMAYTINAASITSVTVTFTCSQKFSFNLVEFTNVAKNSAVDTAASTYTPAPVSPFTVTTPTITTTNDNDLIIGMMSDRTSTMTLQGTSYTALTGMNNTSSLAEEAYRVVSATGNYDMSWNQSAGQGSSSLIMAFKASDPTTNCNVGQISLVKQTVVNVTTATTVDSGRAVTSTAGNTLIMFFQIDSQPSQSLVSVTDSASNTWVIPTGAVSTNPPGNRNGSNTAGIAYALNAAAISSVTVTVQASQRFSYTIAEFTNIASTSAVDGSDTAATTTSVAGASITTPTITTTGNNDLVVAMLANSTVTSTVTNANSTPSEGWIQLSQNTSGSGLGVADAAYIIGPAGSYAANFTMSTAHSYMAGIIAFKVKPTTVTMDRLMRGGTSFCNGGKSKFFWSS